MYFNIDIDFYKPAGNSSLALVAVINVLGQEKSKLSKDLDWLSSNFLELMDSSGGTIKKSYVLKEEFTEHTIKNLPTELQEEFIDSAYSFSPSGTFFSARRYLVFSPENIEHGLGHLINVVIFKLGKLAKRLK